MKLNQLKIIVTGAASGMGRHFVQRLAEAGAQVAAGDVDTDGLGTLAADTGDLAGTVHCRALDVADDQQIADFIDWADAAMSGLNGLINNAGIIRDGLLVKRHRETGAISTMTRARWDEVLAVNLTGATFMVRDTVAKMVAKQCPPGVVVNISSTSRHGNRGQSNYSAAKAALAANTRTWAREFAPFGIRVGAVAPGMVETPMTRGMRQSARDALVARILCGRIGVPEDIWLAVKFILECDYFNGETIDVHGGV